MATLTKSDRTKVAAVFFLIGIIGVVGIITYPSVPNFPDAEIISRLDIPPELRDVPIQQEEPREGEPVVVVEAEEEQVISGEHPQQDLLRQTIDEFHNAFASRDSTATLTYYSQAGANAEWIGQAGAFKGTYKGYNNIRILIATILGNTIDIQINMQNYEVTFRGDRATVVHTLVNTGHGKLIGEFTMEIYATTVWEYIDGKWLIVDDKWEFMNFETEVVAEGTVFPLEWYRFGDYSVLGKNVLISYEEFGLFFNP